MATIAQVLENKRDQYMISVLEEGTTELAALKTKQYLNENLSMIGKVLVEEGVVDAAKANLANNWGKYATGAAGATLAGAAGAAIANPELAAGLVGQGESALNVNPETVANHTKTVYDTLADTLADTKEGVQNVQNNVVGGVKDASDFIQNHNPYAASPDEVAAQNAKAVEAAKLAQMQQEYNDRQMMQQAISAQAAQAAQPKA